MFDNTLNDYRVLKEFQLEVVELQRKLEQRQLVEEAKQEHRPHRWFRK